jgi:hypothetical protein
VNACDVFVYTENLIPKKVEKKKISHKKGAKPLKGQEIESEPDQEPEPLTPDPIKLLKQAFDNAVQDDGWAFLGTLGHHLRQLDPGFDARTYGFGQLSSLIRGFPKSFEIREVKTDDGNSSIYVKMKE